MAGESFDVVVVGGGAGGSSAAAVLARAGLSILVLERETSFRDRVRGEWIAPWGVLELEALGLREVAEGVPHANWLTRAIPFDETLPPELAEQFAFDCGGLLPGVPGCLALGHVELQEALAAEAVARGATMRRGVSEVMVTPGTGPSVTYVHDGLRRTAGARLVIAADGRESGVRRRLGIELSATTPKLNLAGMLVEGVAGWPEELQTVGVEDDLHFLVFPQRDGRVRLYAAWDAADVHRFAGPDRQRRFLDAFRLRCVPGSEAIASARPAGPCVTVPMNDTWTDTIAVEGVVLVGDAAGWSDATIGQGLSVTFRDVHLVTDALLASDEWGAAIFAPYAAERTERMRRLRFTAAAAELRLSFGEEGRAKRLRLGALAAGDPARYSPLVAALVGPWNVPDGAFADETWEALVNA